MARKRNAKQDTGAAVQEATPENQDVDITALEAMLNGDTDTEIEIDDADFADVDVDQDELVAAVAAEESKLAAYEDQDATVDIADDEEVEAKKVASKPAKDDAPEKTTKKAGGSKGSTGQDVNRDPDLFAKAIVGIFANESVIFDADEGELDDAALTQAMKEITQVKVRAKAQNLARHIATGSKLDNYTTIASKVMVAAYLDGCRSVTAGEIKKAYADAGYKPGTQSAQQGQMMSLFTAFGLAKKGSARGTLDPNPNSVILEMLSSS